MRKSCGRVIDPNKIRIGDVVLVQTQNPITIWIQKKLGYGAQREWTHVAGSIGGNDLVEGQVPRSRVANLQNDYIGRDFPIKVMRKTTWEKDYDRLKVALWWATMTNLRYDFFQLIWFALAAAIGRVLLLFRNQFNSRGKEICSELITEGFYKQGYNLFDRKAANILPADFDDPRLFQEITDIWLP